MTLVAGNALQLAIGKQSAKGTAQATAQAVLDYIGGYGPLPDWQTLQTAETDAARQAADFLRVGFAVDGQSEHYLRPDTNHFLTHAVLGATATTGTTDKTHVSTPTADGSAPYYTLVKATGATIEITQMVDVQATKIEWTGGAGQALSAMVDWVGLSAALGADMPAGAASTQAILTYPDVIATYGGVHDGSVQSFKITVDQGRTAWVGDTGTTAFDIVPGLLNVTAELVMLFQSDEEYRNFLTGSTTGTDPSVVIPSKALSIIAAVDANNSVQWDMALAQITDYQRANNTDGSPLLATLELKSAKSATLSDVITVTTKNLIAAP